MFFFDLFRVRRCAGEAPIEQTSPRSPRSKLEKKKSFRRGQELCGEMMILWVIDGYCA